MTNQLEGLLHLGRRGGFATAEVGVTEQGRLGLDTEPAHRLFAQHRDFGDLLRVGLLLDVGVGDEEGTGIPRPWLGVVGACC